MNDNRNYVYSQNSVSKRVEFKVITKWIKRESKVIDLGSGDGTLLKILKDLKQVEGLGIEISPTGIKATEKKGVKSIQGRIDVKLPFKDKEFDYAVCNVTLPMAMYPEVLLREMVRISKKQVISFPNFAYIINRLELLFMGRIPRFMLYRYQWFSTGLIHQLSIKDFEIFCRENHMRVLKTAHIGLGKFLSLPSKFLVKLFPNLFATLGIFLTD